MIFLFWTRPAICNPVRRDWRLRWVPVRRDCSCRHSPELNLIERSWKVMKRCPLRSLPPDIRELSSRHPRVSRRYANQVLPASGLVDDAGFPAIRRRLTDTRARYRCRGRTENPITLSLSLFHHSLLVPAGYIGPVSRKRHANRFSLGWAASPSSFRIWGVRPGLRFSISR